MGYVKIVLMILFSSFLFKEVFAGSNMKSSNESQSLEQVYLNNVKQEQYMMKSLKQGLPLGDSVNYMPIIDPPVVKKVWIPAIEGEGDNQVLVSGHWVYVMLKDSSWKR